MLNCFWSVEKEQHVCSFVTHKTTYRGSKPGYSDCIHFFWQKWQRRFFVLYEHGCLRFALDESVSNASCPLFRLPLLWHQAFSESSSSQNWEWQRFMGENLCTYILVLLVCCTGAWGHIFEMLGFCGITTSVVKGAPVAFSCRQTNVCLHPVFLLKTHLCIIEA